MAAAAALALLAPRRVWRSLAALSAFFAAWSLLVPASWRGAPTLPAARTPEWVVSGDAPPRCCLRAALVMFAQQRSSQ